MSTNRLPLVVTLIALVVNKRKAVRNAADQVARYPYGTLSRSKPYLESIMSLKLNFMRTLYMQSAIWFSSPWQKYHTPFRLMTSFDRWIFYIWFLFCFFFNSPICLVWVTIHLTQFYTWTLALLPQKTIECYTDQKIISQHLYISSRGGSNYQPLFQ